MAKEKINVPQDAGVVGAEKKQKGPFKKRRGGVELTQDQVNEIKAGRKKLRQDLRAAGIRDKKEFELTASSLGLYFDKQKKGALWLWLFTGKLGWLLLGGALLLMLSLFAVSIITQMRGHFTVNMSSAMFREGFTLSETRDFANPTTYLVCTPAEDVPARSIDHIDVDVDNYDGQHNSDYFAYTFYIRNEGESTVDYKWEMALNSESQNLSAATWVMIFEDGQCLFYAKSSVSGGPEMLPPKHVTNSGYIHPPMYDLSMDPEGQYEVVVEGEHFSRWRVIPREFVSEDVVAQGIKQDMEPGEVHKYTVVIWLEGDDPECNNELIGGHLGLEIYMSLMSEEDHPESKGWQESWRDFWDSLGFIS